MSNPISKHYSLDLTGCRHKLHLAVFAAVGVGGAEVEDGRHLQRRHRLERERIVGQNRTVVVDVIDADLK